MQLAALLVLLLVWASPARAHEARSAEIEITPLSADDARVVVVNRAGARASLVAPSECRLEGSLLHCRGLAGRALEVDGTFDVAFVRILGNAPEAAVVTPRARRIQLPGTPASGATVTRYLRLGAEHVLSGLDHVLFLIALFWQARGSGRNTFWELARTATGFTIGHSLTLTATVLGVIHVPAALAEACIAWSLVLVALDIGREASPKSRVALATAFGLAHGLGFAGALAETRLPTGARFLALIAFNAGVELGQLALFAGCVAMLPLVRRLERPLMTLSAYAVGAAGAAMFFARTLLILQ